MGRQQPERQADTRESGERTGGTGRRALLGAAVLGAGGAVLGMPGTAGAAQGGPERGAAARPAGHRGGLKSLPVPTVIGHVQEIVTGPFKTMGVPVKLSATPGAVRAPAPRLGEHSDAILSPREAAE